MSVDKTLLSAEELKSDVRNYIKEVASDYMDCEDMDELRDSLYDNLWNEELTEDDCLVLIDRFTKKMEEEGD